MSFYYKGEFYSTRENVIVHTRSSHQPTKGILFIEKTKVFFLHNNPEITGGSPNNFPTDVQQRYSWVIGNIDEAILPNGLLTNALRASDMLSMKKTNQETAHIINSWETQPTIKNIP